MKKFSFDKSYEEVKIADKVYKIDMSDDKVKDYQQALQGYHKEAEQLTSANLENATPEEQVELFNKQLGMMKVVTETILGEGTFDELYEMSGRSSRNYLKLMLFIAEVMEEKIDEVKSDALSKYLNEKK